MKQLRVDLTVQDKASAPLDKIKDNFEQVKDSVQANDRALAKATEHQKALLEKQKQAVEKLGKSWDSMKQSATVAFAAVAAGAVAAGAMIVSGLEKQAKLDTLKNNLGDNKVFEQMRDYAESAGISIDALVENGNRLAKSYQPEKALALFKALGKLTLAGKLSEEQFGQMSDELNKLAGQTKMGMPEYKKFQEILGKKNLNIPELQKLTGTTIDLKKAIMEGTLSADFFRDALLKIAEAAKVEMTIPGQLKQIKATLENFDVNLVQAIFGKGEAGAKKLAEFGERLREITSPENLRKAVDTFKEWSSVIETVAVAFASIKIGAFVMALKGAIVTSAATATSFGALAASIWAVVWPIAAIAAGLTGLYLLWRNWDKFIASFNTGMDIIVESAKGIWKDIREVGSNIIDGLWDGIKSAFKIVIGKFEGLMKMLPDSVKKLLGIASPSKVFKQLGKNTMIGLQMGLAQSAKPVIKTMETLSGKMIDSIKPKAKISFHEYFNSLPHTDANIDAYKKGMNTWNSNMNNTINDMFMTPKHAQQEAVDTVNSAAGSSPIPVPQMNKPSLPVASNTTNNNINIRIDVQPGGIADASIKDELFIAVERTLKEALSRA